MTACGIFSELSDDALETYRNLTLSLIANSNNVEYTLSYLYNDIKFVISQKHYPVLKFCSSPLDMAFVSGIVDSFKDEGLVDILENEDKIGRYRITDSGLQMYEKLPRAYKVGVSYV